MTHGLILAGIIFAIGLCGVMVRRNFLFMLMSLEIMMSAAALAFVVAGSRWVNPDGQVMFVLILTLAAAEAAIGLAILLQFYHRRGHLDVDTVNEMKNAHEFFSTNLYLSCFKCFDIGIWTRQAE